MADEIDAAANHIEIEDEKRLAAVRRNLAKQEPGVAGECDLCGEYMPRLVERKGDMVCAPCRDKFRLG